MQSNNCKYNAVIWLRKIYFQLFFKSGCPAFRPGIYQNQKKQEEDTFHGFFDSEKKRQIPNQVIFTEEVFAG